MKFTLYKHSTSLDREIPNKNRSFLTVFKNGGRNGVQKIIIPQGQKSERWNKMAECLRNLHLGEREKGHSLRRKNLQTFTYGESFKSYVDSTRFGSWKRAVVCGRFSMASELGSNRAGVTE